MNITGRKGLGAHFVWAFCGDPDGPALYPLIRICITVAFAILLLAVLLGFALPN